MNAHLAGEAYWAVAEARDWDAFGRLLADDVVYEGPQTRERVRGRDAYVRFNVEGFPGAWHLEVQRIVGEANHAASCVEFTRTEGS
jgi:predicted ester cyclase